jgi:uncharacterized membrane protein
LTSRDNRNRPIDRLPDARTAEMELMALAGGPGAKRLSGARLPAGMDLIGFCLPPVIANPWPVLIGFVTQLGALWLATKIEKNTMAAVAVLVVISHLLHFALSARQLEHRLAIYDGSRAGINGLAAFTAKFFRYFGTLLTIAMLVVTPVATFIGALYCLTWSLIPSFNDDKASILGIGCALLLVPGTWLAVRLAFAPLFALDRDMTVLASLRASFRASSGRVNQLAGYLPAVIGLTILCVATGGLALPVVAPMASWAAIRVYRSLVAPAFGGTHQKRVGQLHQEPRTGSVPTEHVSSLDILAGLSEGLDL